MVLQFQLESSRYFPLLISIKMTYVVERERIYLRFRFAWLANLFVRSQLTERKQQIDGTLKCASNSSHFYQLNTELELNKLSMKQKLRVFLSSLEISYKLKGICLFKRSLLIESQFDYKLNLNIHNYNAFFTLLLFLIYTISFRLIFFAIRVIKFKQTFQTKSWQFRF